MHRIALGEEEREVAALALLQSTRNTERKGGRQGIDGSHFRSTATVEVKRVVNERSVQLRLTHDAEDHFYRIKYDTEVETG